jgi:membrane protein
VQPRALARLLRDIVGNFVAHDMSTRAAALAYQILFSLFPFVIFLLALVGTLGLPDFVSTLRQQAVALLPQPAVGPVNQVLDELQVPRGGLLSVSAVLALWSASAGMRATMNAFNVAYGVAESRPAWKVYLLSLLYTLGLAVLSLASAGLLLLAPRAMQWLADLAGIDRIFVVVWTWMRWPMAILLVCVSAALVYRSAPAVQPRYRLVTPGAVVAVLVWVAASKAFDFYAANFANYSATYGSIGSVVVLLAYFYLTSAVLLMGAEINATSERHKRGRAAGGQC